MRFSARLLGMVAALCVAAGWGPYRPPHEPPQEPPTEPPAQDLACDLPVTETPEQPVDACRAGVVVLSERVERHKGPPETKTFEFEVIQGGVSCLVVEGGPGRHSPASAKIWIDGELALSPRHLSHRHPTATIPTELEPGVHELTVRVASKPGTFVDVSVRTGGTERQNEVRSAHLELYNLWAEPHTFSPSTTSTALSAEGTVRFTPWPGRGCHNDEHDHHGHHGHHDQHDHHDQHSGCGSGHGCNGNTPGSGQGHDGPGKGGTKYAGDGKSHGESSKRCKADDKHPGHSDPHEWPDKNDKPGSCQEYVVHWAYEIRSASTCEIVRVLTGEHAGPEPSFSATAQWDGKDEMGIVHDGTYLVRLVAQLVSTKHGHVLDELATAQQRLVVSCESDAHFCARLGKNCGTVTALDDCGYERSVSCGTCSLPEICGVGVVDNLCHVVAYADAPTALYKVQPAEVDPAVAAPDETFALAVPGLYDGNPAHRVLLSTRADVYLFIDYRNLTANLSGTFFITDTGGGPGHTGTDWRLSIPLKLRGVGLGGQGSDGPLLELQSGSQPSEVTSNWLYFDVVGSIMVDSEATELVLTSGDGTQPSPVQLGIAANNKNLGFGASARLEVEQASGSKTPLALHLNLIRAQ